MLESRWIALERDANWHEHVAGELHVDPLVEANEARAERRPIDCCPKRLAYELSYGEKSAKTIQH
jgi:hypothetical protein